MQHTETYAPTTRNGYGALTHKPDFCLALMREAEAAGVWTTGIESDKRQRGTAVNADLYGYNLIEQLAIVQVRETVFRPGRYSRVRKDYYLIGRTESGNVFAHPVSSPARSKRAMASPEACVRWTLAQIWQCTEAELEDIERQGDVALVPVRALPTGTESVAGPVMIRGTHELTGEIWRHGDDYYTRRGARLRHTKGQHAAIRARYGYYRVQPGLRESVWGFTAPRGD